MWGRANRVRIDHSRGRSGGGRESGRGLLFLGRFWGLVQGYGHVLSIYLDCDKGMRESIPRKTPLNEMRALTVSFPSRHR